MDRLKQVIERVKEYEDNNCFELKTSVVLHWLKEIENKALAISRVGSAFYCQRDIEGDSICNTQCEHCNEYYKPLEQ